MRKTCQIPSVILILLVVSNVAAAETCKLQTYASSWMATGTPFSVKCPSGDYSGHLVSLPHAASSAAATSCSSSINLLPCAPKKRAMKEKSSPAVDVKSPTCSSEVA